LALQRSSNPNLKGYDHGNNVLNGIAYDKEKGEFYVTGKRWEFMFKITID